MSSDPWTSKNFLADHRSPTAALNDLLPMSLSETLLRRCRLDAKDKLLEEKLQGHQAELRDWTRTRVRILKWACIPTVSLSLLEPDFSKHHFDDLKQSSRDPYEPNKSINRFADFTASHIAASRLDRHFTENCTAPNRDEERSETVRQTPRNIRASRFYLTGKLFRRTRGRIGNLCLHSPQRRKVRNPCNRGRTDCVHSLSEGE